MNSHDCPFCCNTLHYIETNVAIDADLWCYECLVCGIDYDIHNNIIEHWAIGDYWGIEMVGTKDDDEIGVAITNGPGKIIYQCEWSLPTAELISLYNNYLILQ